MTQLTIPTLNIWYRLPDADVFRVIAVDLDQGNLEIQFTDGAQETLDLATWQKLGVEKTGSVFKRPTPVNDDFNEFDYYEMGAAPGAEAFDFSAYAN